MENEIKGYIKAITDEGKATKSGIAKVIGYNRTHLMNWLADQRPLPNVYERKLVEYLNKEHNIIVPNDGTPVPNDGTLYTDQRLVQIGKKAKVDYVPNKINLGESTKYHKAFKKGIHPSTLNVMELLNGATIARPVEPILKHLLNDKIVMELVGNGLTEWVKGKNKDSYISRLRLNKKGRSWLRGFNSVHVDEHDNELFQWLSEFYLKRNKKIGNSEETKRLISWFRVESNLTIQQIFLLVREFVHDENNMEYSNVLEYIFFKPKSLYDKKELSASRLWQFYRDNETSINNKFLKYETVSN